MKIFAMCALAIMAVLYQSGLLIVAVLVVFYWDTVKKELIALGRILKKF